MPRGKSRHGSGNVRYRAGAWRIQVYSGRTSEGRVRFEHRTVHAPNTAKGRREAETVARALYDDISARTAAPETVQGVIDRYISHRTPDWSPGEPDRNRKLLARHVFPAFGHLPANRLTTAAINDLYLRLRTEEELSPGSIRRIHAFLRAALEHSKVEGFLTRNPAVSARLPRQRAPQAMHVPTPAQVRAMIALTGPEPVYAALIRLGVHTGARTGELVRLRWADLDLDDRWVRVWQSKTRAEKVLALGERTTGELERWRGMLAAQHQAMFDGPMAADWWVFPSVRKPGQHLGESAVSHTWARLRSKAGLDGVPFKVLRKTMSTVCLTAGVDVRTVMGRGGWSAESIEPGARVMLRHYAQMVTESDRRAAEIMDGWLEG